jgi:hypothetical protein
MSNRFTPSVYAPAPLETMGQYPLPLRRPLGRRFSVTWLLTRERSSRSFG